MSKTTHPKKTLDPELFEESSSDNPAEVLSYQMQQNGTNEKTAISLIDKFLKKQGDTKENRESVLNALSDRMTFEGKDANEVPNDLKFSLKLISEYNTKFEETKTSYKLPDGIDSKTFNFSKFSEEGNIASVVIKKGLSKKLASLGSAIIGRIKESVRAKKKVEISSEKGKSR